MLFIRPDFKSSPNVSIYALFIFIPVLRMLQTNMHDVNCKEYSKIGQVERALFTQFYLVDSSPKEETL